MKPTLIPLISLTLIWFAFFLAGEQKPTEEALPQRYRDWLDLTHYIILPEEREVFQKLSSDRERDLFIEAFWNQRDPTPGTPQNEYQEEIRARFLEANRQFRRGTTREGWMTDMGKVYILLGPPASRERYTEVRGIYPCEVWFYYGDVKKGLPDYFGLLFFQKGGVGEFKLYNPLVDGPVSLLVDRQNLEGSDYPALYKRIKDLAPTLAPLAFSPVPGEMPTDYQPSLRTELILASITKSPRQDVSSTYATHFLNYRGLVSTEYLTNYVDIEGLAEVIPDPSQGLSFVHFLLQPKAISVGFYQPKNQYYCNYIVDVSLRDGDKIIYQYAKEFPVYYSAEDDQTVRASGFSLQDSFPVIEGTHQLTILVRNSVSKEFSVFEKNITVEKLSGVKILGPWLCYQVEMAAANVRAPFQLSETRLFLEPENVFGHEEEITVAFGVDNVGESLWSTGEIRIIVRSQNPMRPVEKSVSFPLNRKSYSPLLYFQPSFGAGELGPDYYEMTISLVAKDSSVVAASRANFIVSPVPTLPRPVVVAKTFPLANAFLYAFMAADQYDRADELAKALTLYQKAVSLAPEYKEGLLYYSNFLVKIGQYREALQVVEKIKDEEKFHFDYWLIKGRAHMGLGQYDEAISSLLAGNAIYDSDIQLLNNLGFCFLKVGKKEEARRVLEASLRLNPEQPETRKFLEEARK